MSTAAERLATTTRRRAIIALLFFAPGRSLNTPRLVRQLEDHHGQVASTAKVRTDLATMADQGYLTYVSTDDAATLTESGRDVAMDRIEIVV